MPELPHLSGAEVVKVPQRLGFAVGRRRGSHVMLRRGASGCVVPMHREVKTGTLHGVLNQAGVDPRGFIAALR